MRVATSLLISPETERVAEKVPNPFGKPFFVGPRPPFRLVTSDLVGEDVIRLTYVPA